MNIENDFELKIVVSDYISWTFFSVIMNLCHTLLQHRIIVFKRFECIWLPTGTTDVKVLFRRQSMVKGRKGKISVILWRADFWLNSCIKISNLFTKNYLHSIKYCHFSPESSKTCKTTTNWTILYAFLTCKENATSLSFEIFGTFFLILKIFSATTSTSTNLQINYKQILHTSRSQASPLHRHKITESNAT